MCRACRSFGTDRGATGAAAAAGRSAREDTGLDESAGLGMPRWDIKRLHSSSCLGGSLVLASLSHVCKVSGLHKVGRP